MNIAMITAAAMDSVSSTEWKNIAKMTTGMKERNECRITKNIDDETILCAEDDVIRVELVDIGEGYNGDYDPDDPEDEELLRFYVYIMNNEEKEWIPVDDASYCTNLKLADPICLLEPQIKKIFKAYRDVADNIRNGESVKKLGERLSWIMAQ